MCGVARDLPEAALSYQQEALMFAELGVVTKNLMGHCIFMRSCAFMNVGHSKASFAVMCLLRSALYSCQRLCHYFFEACCC